jgi:hypothetical protein
MSKKLTIAQGLERLEAIHRDAITPALLMLPPQMTSPRAEIMLCAITLQEADGLYRRQLGNGPAMGLWQFEEGGGVRGVMRHDATAMHALSLCSSRNVPFVQRDVWAALEHDDVLAAGFARLLLWTLPGTLPSPLEQARAWEQYVDAWRPGKPHPEKWSTCQSAAVQFITRVGG